MGCESLLGTIDVPDSVVEIGSQAFMDCSVNTEDPIIRIPSTVQKIGEDAFSGVQRLILFRGRTMSQIRSMENYPWGMQEYGSKIRAGETEILREIPRSESSQPPDEPDCPEPAPIPDQNRDDIAIVPLYNHEYGS